eukprot:gene13740-13861_t
MTVTLYYWPLRGRAEVIKLLCAAKDVELEIVEPGDYAIMKSDREHYPFGQMVDGDVDMTQSNAMIRHLARKHDLYGISDKEQAHVDMLIDGVESIRGKYLVLIYQDELKEPAKSTYWKTHGARDNADSRNGGAHFDYLEQYLGRNSDGTGYVVGSNLTAADLCVWEIVDLHLRIFKEEMEPAYPLLVAHHKRIAELPGIKEYLASPARLDKVNNNMLG